MKICKLYHLVFQENHNEAINNNGTDPDNANGFKKLSNKLKSIPP